MAIGLGMVDPIRGSDFGARHLLLALDAGEPRRIARALGLEAAYRAIEPGGRAASRSLLATARTLAGELGDPHVSGLVRLLGATTAYVSGEPAPALELARQAEAELRSRCVGVSWSCRRPRSSPSRRRSGRLRARGARGADARHP